MSTNRGNYGPTMNLRSLTRRQDYFGHGFILCGAVDSQAKLSRLCPV